MSDHKRSRKYNTLKGSKRPVLLIKKDDGSDRSSQEQHSQPKLLIKPKDREHQLHTFQPSQISIAVREPALQTVNTTTIASLSTSSSIAVSTQDVIITSVSTNNNPSINSNTNSTTNEILLSSIIPSSIQKEQVTATLTTPSIITESQQLQHQQQPSPLPPPVIIPIKTMKKPIQLLNESYQINQQSFDYLIDTNVDFFVIGIVGQHAVGKSTMLNFLINEDENNNNNGNNDKSGNNNNNNNIFETRSSKKYKFTTMPSIEGIQMYIARDRTIYLDCTSILCNTYKKDFIISEIDDIKLILLLMNICHVLIIVQENMIELPLLRIIKCAEMMKTNLDKEAREEYFPNILFIKNYANYEDFHGNNKRKINEFYKHMFKDSKLKIYPRNFDNKNDVNIVLIPNFSQKIPTSSLFYGGYPNKSLLIADYYQRVFMSPRNQLFTVQQGSFTERNWSQLIVNVWESFKSNYFLKTYETYKEKDWGPKTLLL